MSFQERLAILGGDPVISYEFGAYSSIDETDSAAVSEVMLSKELSRFLGASGQDFLGGKRILEMESAWSAYFGVQNSISVNSWTSGLWIAIGALNLEPGSEIIVSSWTMAATATTILHWNLIPVFADIESDSFNLDPLDVENRITSRTRAIISPDIFGQSADIENLLAICEKYDLKLISDSAQSPGAKRNGYLAGTKSHIGGYSLNYHKHIQSGEGGIAVTNSAELALRMQLLRNHGEVFVGQEMEDNPPFGILGMNMRMGEIEAAITKNQLNKLESAIKSRMESANLLIEGLKDLPGLFTPETSTGNTHVYYVFGLKIDNVELGLHRKTLADALKAEGVPALLAGYQNIHKLPLFSRQLTYKNNPLPYSLLSNKRRKELMNTKLPIAEKLHDEEFLGINWCSKQFDIIEVDLIVSAFHKIWRNLEKLKNAFN